MNLYGLIGLTLKHSFSQKYFREKFSNQQIDADYVNFELSDIKQFSEIFENHDNVKGLSVTIPYKEKIIPFLDELSDEALEIGAINTIKVLKKNEAFYYKGYNTDCFGFQKSLEPYLTKVHTHALILGDGGAAKAVKYVLKKNGIRYQTISRKPKENELTYSQLSSNLISTHKLIVNTTPLGMFPNVETYPDIPYAYLSEDHVLYDLVYNPEQTQFMNKGIEKGAVVVNGLKMLESQAEKAWEIWNS